jgi:hypothetical protein
MKNPILLAIALAVTCMAAEPAKPALALTAKKHLVDSDSGRQGRQASTREKSITLRVEITNQSSATIAGAELSGDALVKRDGSLKDGLFKESLGKIAIPELKPNARVTIDLGTISLHELDGRSRKVEDSLEGWKVVATKGGTEIGTATSGADYEALAGQSVTRGKPGKAGKAGRRQPGK